MTKFKSNKADRILLNGFCLKDSIESEDIEIIVSLYDAEKAVLVAEEEAEIRCKQVFCQVLHELQFDNLDMANVVDRYDELLKLKADEYQTNV